MKQSGGPPKACEAPFSPVQATVRVRLRVGVRARVRARVRLG